MDSVKINRAPVLTLWSAASSCGAPLARRLLENLARDRCRVHVRGDVILDLVAAETAMRLGEFHRHGKHVAAPLRRRRQPIARRPAGGGVAKRP